MSPKIKWLAWGAAIILLVYTRFMNLSWGLPFPFHPDERNMANAVQSLNCEISNFKFQISNCFNPHFFAYGQLPIYLGYVLIFISRLVTKISGAVRFDEAIMVLRFISAAASLATAFVMLNLFQHLTGSRIKSGMTMASMLIVIFSPALIQFAHFGTTESLLMLFFIWLVYLCLKLDATRDSKDVDSIYIWIGVVTGLAIATKVSSILFILLPCVSIALSHFQPTKLEVAGSRYERFWQWFNEMVFITFVAGATAIIFSPYNLISWKEFTSSIDYESMVATGKVLVFYTRSFTDSVPILFQFQRIFPYSLGWPVFVMFLVGFVFLPWKRNFNMLRLAFLIYFLPSVFVFTKWTRFMAPIFPLMIVFAVLWISRLPKRLGYLACLVSIIPGIMFLKIYTTEDVRLQASQWMVKNIPSNSVVLQETANVVDLPVFLGAWSVEPRAFRNISFNFYDLDSDRKLQQELEVHLKKSDYIIIPSRRVFKNHAKDRYPILNKYYEDLFSGKLGFKKVVEFKILDDEDAEETWTVFDHPVIRIYERNK